MKNKASKLLDLNLEGSIDKETYLDKKGNFDKKIKKLEEEKTIISSKSNYVKKHNDAIQKFKEQFKNNIALERFDSEVFEILVERIIVGTNENGIGNPRALTFVLRNGEKKVNMSECYEMDINFTDRVKHFPLILEFESFCDIITFDKKNEIGVGKNIHNMFSSFEYLPFVLHLSSLHNE